MRNIKLTIEYDGTAYCGWQRQKNGLSVQAVIEETLKQILKEDVKIIGAGRTDSGVHAKEQVASFRTLTNLSTHSMLKALNGSLPMDISARDIKEAHRAFNARFDAKTKIYRYRIFNDINRSPFAFRYAVHMPRKLNLRLMKEASKVLLGRHDFSSFRSANSSTKTSIREINNIAIKKRKNLIIIDIKANGFLYNMARAIVGTLIEVGLKKTSPLDIKRILRSRDRSLAGPTAPAKGLTLYKIEY